MRIVLITDNHTPAGGAEKYFFDLKERLKHVPGIEIYSMGFGPDHASGNDYFVLKKLTSNVSKLIWQVIFHPVVYLKLRRQLKKIRPDVIHIHNVKQYTVSLLRAIKPYPIVQTIHDYGVICPTAHNIHKDYQPCLSGMRMKCFWQHQVKYNPIVYLGLVYSFFKLRKRLRKTVKKFFAPSPLLVEYLKKNHFNDATYIAPFRKEKQSYTFDKIKPYHFLFAGNLGTHKGIYTLLDEFALAYQDNNQLSLTIAGTGPEEARLRNRTKELGLEKNVFFLGWQTTLENEYAKCAAVICPSLWMEAFGLVITEAMSYARPVIGSNRGSPPWLIDDHQTGFIFNPLKKGDLAERLLIVAGNVNLIKKLGTNGHEKLQRLIDNEAVLNQIVALYRDCLPTPMNTHSL